MALRARIRRVATGGVCAALVASAGGASAQPGAAARRKAPPRPAIAEARPVEAEDLPAQADPDRLSLRDRFGVQRGEALLGSYERDARLRGVARLATAGTDEAVDVLVEALEAGRASEADVRTRLAIVRVLADHAGDEDVQQVLAEVLEQEPSVPRDEPLARLARSTAALALAREGGRDALVPLYTAVITGGSSAAMAREALRAYPPSQPLLPLGERLDELSPRVIHLLGELGDPRVLGVLRKQARRDDEAAERAAVIALAKLGDEHALEPVPEWLEGDDLRNRLLAAEIQVLLGAPQAAATVAALLGKAKTRSAALSLAERLASPRLVPTLEAVVGAEVTAAERARATALLAKIGDDRAAAALLRLLSKPELATRAAFGLAQSRTATARVGLERALAQAEEGAAWRLAARAGIARHVLQGERSAALVDALSGALDGDDARDRAVAAFGLVALGERSPGDLLDGEPAVARAAARGALARGPVGLAAVAELVGRDDPSLQAAGANALLVSAADVSPLALARRAERGGAWAPLAAYRLAALDPARLRKRIRRLLEASDPVVRAQVALGLGHSPEPDAVSLLVEAYRFETDPEVRRAILRGLSLRSEPRRQATLALASALDPDSRARALARSAASGRRLPAALLDDDRLMWVTLRPSRAGVGVGGWPVTVVRDDGLALVGTSAPDGVLVLPGLGPTGRVTMRAAAQPLAAPTKRAPRPAGAPDAAPEPAPDPREEGADEAGADGLAPTGDPMNPDADGEG